LDPCHCSFCTSEMCHYYSPIWKLAITIVSIADLCHFLRLKWHQTRLQIVVFSYSPKYPSDCPLSTQWHAGPRSHPLPPTFPSTVCDGSKRPEWSLHYAPYRARRRGQGWLSRILELDQCGWSPSSGGARRSCGRWRGMACGRPCTSSAPSPQAPTHPQSRRTPFGPPPRILRFGMRRRGAESTELGGQQGPCHPQTQYFFITYKYFNCSAIKINISSIFMIILCIFCYEY
jgi:hypothetical protein